MVLLVVSTSELMTQIHAVDLTRPSCHSTNLISVISFCLFPIRDYIFFCSDPLRTYRTENVVLTLPAGKSITDYTYIAIGTNPGKVGILSLPCTSRSTSGDHYLVKYCCFFHFIAE